MCRLCDDSEDGSMETCPECTRVICFEIETADDVFAPAYVTASGDLYCRGCGRMHDWEEEVAEEEYCGEIDYDPYS